MVADMTARDDYPFLAAFAEAIAGEDEAEEIRFALDEIDRLREIVAIVRSEAP